MVDSPSTIAGTIICHTVPHPPTGNTDGAGKGVDVDQKHLADGGDHEAGHRDAQNHQKHNDAVRPAVAIQRRKRAPQNAAKGCKDNGENAQDRGNRENAL